MTALRLICEHMHALECFVYPILGHYAFSIFAFLPLSVLYLPTTSYLVTKIAGWVSPNYKKKKCPIDNEKSKYSMSGYLQFQNGT